MTTVSSRNFGPDGKQEDEYSGQKPAYCFFLDLGVLAGSASSGNGNRIVEFFSAAILDKVW
jgi:hypothetical protein